jgi:hypothetical protein
MSFAAWAAGPVRSVMKPSLMAGRWGPTSDEPTASRPTSRATTNIELPIFVIAFSLSGV